MIAVDPAKAQCVVQAADGIKLVFGVDAALPFFVLGSGAAVGGDFKVFGAEFICDLVAHVPLHLPVAGHQCPPDGNLDPAAHPAGVVDVSKSRVGHGVDRPLQYRVIRKSAGFNVHHGIVQRLGVKVPEGLITHLPGRVFHRKAHGLGNVLKGAVGLRRCGFDQILNGLILLEENLAGTFY